MLRKKNYIFSIIIPIYNSDMWLKKAIESIINQSIGFENIQLILVNDGSKDSSLEICKTYKRKYKENIEIIIKENGGVASARNASIKYIKGQYVEFLDSDDFLSNNVLENVYKFFIKNKDKIDIVAIPMYYFDGRTGEHYLNKKFEKGNRIIDLETDFTDIFVHINSIFIKSKIIKKYKFDETLVTCEDGKMAIQLLLEKQRYGVINNCQYNYRLRKNNKNSLSQVAKRKKGWYIDQLINYPFWIYEYCNKKVGNVPYFVKYIIACHLQWRFKTNSYDYEILTEMENKVYKYLLMLSVQYIDDNIINELNQISEEEKEYIKLLKIN